jgi:CheY-like chemotaxis protein
MPLVCGRAHYGHGVGFRFAEYDAWTSCEAPSLALTYSFDEGSSDCRTRSSAHIGRRRRAREDVISEEAIAGRRILIVNDEFFVADSLAMCLASVGAIVVGPVHSLAAALDLVRADDRLEGALLDVNLHGEKAFPVADALEASGVPFVFMTGYGSEAIPERFASIPRCAKPFQFDELIQLLSR